MQQIPLAGIYCGYYLLCVQLQSLPDLEAIPDLVKPWPQTSLLPNNMSKQLFHGC